jgi:hypothetical protein
MHVLTAGAKQAHIMCNSTLRCVSRLLGVLKASGSQQKSESTMFELREGQVFKEMQAILMLDSAID